MALTDDRGGRTTGLPQSVARREILVPSSGLSASASATGPAGKHDGDLGGNRLEPETRGGCLSTVRSGLAHELAVFDDVGEALVVLVNVEGTVMLMDLAREKILGVSGDDMVGGFRELLVGRACSGPADPR